MRADLHDILIDVLTFFAHVDHMGVSLENVEVLLSHVLRSFQFNDLTLGKSNSEPQRKRDFLIGLNGISVDAIKLVVLLLQLSVELIEVAESLSITFELRRNNLLFSKDIVNVPIVLIFLLATRLLEQAIQSRYCRLISHLPSLLIILRKF